MTRAERNKDYEINFEYYVTELMKYHDLKLQKNPHPPKKKTPFGVSFFK